MIFAKYIGRFSDLQYNLIELQKNGYEIVDIKFQSFFNTEEFEEHSKYLIIYKGENYIDNE